MIARQLFPSTSSLDNTMCFDLCTTAAATPLVNNVAYERSRLLIRCVDPPHALDEHVCCTSGFRIVYGDDGW